MFSLIANAKTSKQYGTDIYSAAKSTLLAEDATVQV